VRRVAVCNAGSATLKLAVMRVDDGTVRAERRRHDEWPASGARGLAEALAGLGGPFDAVGHRVVHGGSAFEQPVEIDDAVIAAIERLTPLAPVHNARALALIRAAREAMPDTPGYAVFDTAFHAGRSDASMCYALPAGFAERFGFRRYGFHGLAHASLLASLAETLGQPPAAITAVTLQLGSGCSACAIAGGRSVETSMGFTPLEGLVMPSRSGDIDPAIVVQLIRAGYGADEVERLLTEESGLKGLSGSADVRDLIEAEAAGDARAALALRVFARRAVMIVGAYLTLLAGRGSIVFGGGIGRNSPVLRERIAAGLSAWGVGLDPALNTANAPGRISAPGCRDVFVLETDEERIIAREVAELLPESVS
jgi:acetate kinase